MYMYETTLCISYRKGSVHSKVLVILIKYVYAAIAFPPLKIAEQLQLQRHYGTLKKVAVTLKSKQSGWVASFGTVYM